MKGKLNIFQRTVLLWNENHPYNAVHVIRINHPLEIRELKSVIDNYLEKCGLVSLVIDSSNKTYQYYDGTSDVQIIIIEDGPPHTSLQKEIKKQLNTPFSIDGPIHPFRFFVLKEHGFFYLGLVYFHLIAGDIDSIIPLLKDIEIYYKDRKVPELRPYNLYPGTIRILPLCSSYIRVWLLTFYEHITHMRKSCRPIYHDMNNNEIGFIHFNVQSLQYHGLIRACRNLEVTVNDMFLAILLKSLAPLAEKRKHERRRKNISIASIVNIRKDLMLNRDVFGLFLSYFNVSHHIPEGITLVQLVKDIHIQTNIIKNNKLYLRTIFDLQAALLLVNLFFRKRKKKFYEKYNPVWCGISNINLNAIWPSYGVKSPEYYLRAVSTGNATPLVFSFTTSNDTVNIGVSFRYAVFSEADINNIISAFLKNLSNVNEEIL